MKFLKVAVVGLLLVGSGSVFAKGSGEALGIHGPERVGTSPGKPFIFLIPATGPATAKLSFSVTGLPSGLSVDAHTGIISGSVETAGTYEVVLSVSSGTATAIRNLEIVAGKNQLALTPPMGWNSWNVWGCEIDEKKIRAAADELVSSGLAAHGFNYVNIDDCWQVSRTSDGEIIPDPKKFPNMKRLADYVHSKGLRFGIYSGPNDRTCQGRPGSIRHEKQDADSYADWGVDYLKYDWCAPYDKDPKPSYAIMGSLLKQSSRDIVYSLCEYGWQDVWKWGPSVGGNLWRTTGDIEDKWTSLVDIGFGQTTIADYAGPGHWNDPDMLVVGMLGGAWQVGGYHPTGLSNEEQITHITMWSMEAAPLLIGADLTKLDEFTKSILTNDEVLAIDQDPLGKAAKVIDMSGVPSDIRVYTRPLANGDIAVGIFNVGDAPETATLHESALQAKSSSWVRNLWKHEALGLFADANTFEVPSHGAVMLRIGRAKMHTR